MLGCYVFLLRTSLLLFQSLYFGSREQNQSNSCKKGSTRWCGCHSVVFPSWQRKSNIHPVHASNWLWQVRLSWLLWHLPRWVLSRCSVQSECFTLNWVYVLMHNRSARPTPGPSVTGTQIVMQDWKMPHPKWVLCSKQLSDKYGHAEEPNSFIKARKGCFLDAPEMFSSVLWDKANDDVSEKW